MELVLEPWHWFVLGILLILSELLLPAFACPLVRDWCHYGWHSVLDVPDDGTDHPDPDLDHPVCSLYLALVQVYQAAFYRQDQSQAVA